MKTQTMATLVGMGTLAIGSVAPAETVTYIAHGNITSLTDTGNLTGGATTWSWTYSFDSAAADQVPGDPEIGQYALGDWELTLGALTVSSTGGEINVFDDFLGIVDGYLVISGSLPAGWIVFDPSFVLDTADLSTFGSDALPLTPPSPADFDNSAFDLTGITDVGDVLIVDGDVKSIVPAPAALPLLAAGGLLVSRRRRRE